MLYKKASEMKPTPIPHCMGGEGTVMMERLLDAPAEMLGKGRAYVRHTLAPGVTIGRHTHEHEMESMVIVSGRAVHIINGEEQILEKGDIIAAMPGDTHQIACLGDEPLVPPKLPPATARSLCWTTTLLAYRRYMISMFIQIGR